MSVTADDISFAGYRLSRSQRQLLGPMAIATIPGRGYRFTAALDGSMPEGPSSATAMTAAAMASGAAPTNIPEHRALLYGRASDVEEVKALMLANTLVTLVGAGGIGKTVASAAMCGAEIG